MPEPEIHTCPVCNGRKTREFARAVDVEYHSSEQTYTYLACETCRSLFLEDPPVNQLHRIYPSNYYSYQPSHGSLSAIQQVKQRLDARVFRKLLKGIPGEHLSVLDVGGGSGWLLSLIRRTSDRVTSTHVVDIDAQARRAAESAGHIFHCCRIEDLRDTPSFDLILMLNLIEHVADPGGVLIAMRKRLSPNGLILIKTPNVDTLDCRLFRHRNWGGFHCPRHFVLFNRASLLNLGRRCGLRMVQASYTQGAPQWTCSILGWLSLRGLVSISADRPMHTHFLFAPIAASMAVFDLARSPFMTTAQMFVVFGLDGSHN